MKIGGVYILSRRSIARMIAVIAAAFAMICTSAASSADMVLANRCANAAQSLLSLKCTLAATSASRAVVPDLVYLESKSLYLMQKMSVASTRRAIAPPVQHGTAAVSACGFSSRDRKLLNEIHRAAVFGEIPVDARVSGDIRRRQVLYGASLYRPSSSHVKGVSSTQAARSAIKQFRGRPGAYSLEETASLAKAILREYQSLKT